MIEILQDSHWEKIPNLVYGFTTRWGGVSSPPYEEFNGSLSVGDDPLAVETNRKRFSEQLGISLSQCFTVRQVHGNDILVIDKEGSLPDSKDLQKGHDALITNRVEVLLGIQTADCLPLLMVDDEKNVAAAVHAGWKGTYLGIAMKVIAEMSRLYQSSPREVQVLLGPSIGRCCYQFGDPEIQEFKERYLHHARWIESRSGSYFLDIREANRCQLLSRGVPAENIRSITRCTCCEREEFFSVRREETTGRHLNFIMLRSKGGLR